MQFTYLDAPAREEPVAYIGADGDLRIKLAQETGTLVLCTDLSGGDFSNKGAWWRPKAPGVRRVFYPGDSLTITF